MQSENDYELERHFALAAEEELASDSHPCLTHMSGAFTQRFSVVSDEAAGPPEYVYMNLGGSRSLMDEEFLALEIFIADWNTMWEAGNAQRLFDDRLPKRLNWLRTAPTHNIRLVPHVGRQRYEAFSPIYHLLPLETLRYFGLPVLRKGT